MCNVIEVADAAELIVNGYAFTRDGDSIKVLNLNKPDRATIITRTGDVLETSMDDIEIDIVLDYYSRNRRYMEE